MRRLSIATAVIVLSFAGAYVAVQSRLAILTITILTAMLVLTYCWLLVGLAVQASTRMRRVISWASLAVGLLPAFIVAAAVSSHLVNNWRLSVFANQLLSNSPDGARVALQQARVGVLTGNGNHCDFIVDVLVRGDVSAEALCRHYESLPIGRAVPGEVSEVHLDVSEKGTGDLIITLTDAPNDAALDLRCI